MKSCRRLGYAKARLIACLITLGVALFSSATAQAAPQYNLTCVDCHHMPPLDSAGARDPATGRVKGNHESHAGATAASCAKCHGNGILTYGSGHRNKLIEVQVNINSSPAVGTYSRVFVNQTSVPPNPLGNCSNVNCHFESPSPQWGNANFVAPTDCSQCHLMAPSTGNHPITGSKHGVYYGTGAGSCQKCHPDHTAEALPFSHATSAANRGIVVHFTASPNSGGTYSGNGLNFLPSQNKTTYGNCSNLYCHSNGNSGAPNTLATWGSTLPADCTGCHDGNASAVSILGSGTHAKHINNAAYVSGPNLGTNYECARCHSTTVSVGNDRAVTTIANHVDGTKTVAFNNGGTFGGNACSATLCHAAGKASAPQPAAPVWGGAALDCKGCHGVGGSFGEPSYASGGVAADLANSHSAEHMAGPANCVNCHANTTADGVSIKSGSTVHADGSINVNISAAYDLGGASYNATIGIKSCSSTYCHSNGNSGLPLQTARWGGSMPANCSGCHGGDASVTPASSVLDTYKHRAHMNNYTSLGRGNNLKCAECHAKTVSLASNQAISNAANHVNTFKDYSGAKAGSYAGGATKVCSNVYCHSSGQAVAVFRNMTGQKAWDKTASLGCNGCHGYGPGYFAPAAGEPNYPSAAGKENSHKKHTVDAGMADSRGCANCHRTTVDSGIANKLRDYSSAHLNKVRDISFARMGNYTGHYTAAGKSCSNTYCHAGGAAAWGGASLACYQCHKADATLPGRHDSHWSATGTYPTSYTAAPANTGDANNYRFQCSSCHNGAHANGPALGGSGNAAEVFFNYTAAGWKGTYAYGGVTANDGTLQWSNGTCAATYCHSNGNGANGNTTAFAWNGPAKSLRCDGCHGGDASKPATKIATGLHLNHIDPSSNASLGTGNGRKCGECHAKTVGFANNSTVTDKTRHVNKFKDYSGVYARGTANYTIATKSCSSLYCHSNGKPGTAVAEYKNPASWNSGGTLQCNGCHGNNTVSPDAGLPTDPNLGAPNYLTGPAGSNTANSHKLHVQKMGIVNSTGCYNCHSRTVDKNAAAKFRPYSTMHVSGGTNIRFAGISSAWKATYTPGVTNMTCSTVACHSNGKGGYQDVKWGATTNCALCHALNKLSRGHAFHIYTGAANNPTSYDNYTANRSNKGVAPGRYNYGCAVCHPVNNPNHTKGTVLIDLYPGSANVVGLLRSRNGASITVGGVPSGTPGSGSTVAGNTLTCANVYCHSNGYTAAPVYATTPDWYNGSFTGDRCANCHGNAPNSSIAGSASHYNNNWLGTAGATGGHAIGIHATSIANSANFTGVLTPGSSDPSSHGQTASVTPTTIGCNTCHYSVITTSANNGSAQCAGCHTLPATQATATIADKSLHVNGSVAVSFRPTKLYSKAQLKDASFALFSSAYMQRSNGYKASNSFDTSKLNLNTGSYAGNGGNCTTVCHFNKPVRWDNVPAATCSSCHSSL